MNTIGLFTLLLLLWVFWHYHPIASPMHDYRGIRLTRSMSGTSDFSYVHVILLLGCNPMIACNYRILVCSISAFMYGLWVWLKVNELPLL